MKTAKSSNIEVTGGRMISTEIDRKAAKEAARASAVSLVEVFADSWEEFFELKTTLREVTMKCIGAFMSCLGHSFEILQSTDSDKEKLENWKQTNITLAGGLGTKFIELQLYFSKDEEDSQVIKIPYTKAITLSFMIDNAYDELFKDKVIQTDFVIAKSQIQHKLETMKEVSITEVCAIMKEDQE